MNMPNATMSATASGNTGGERPGQVTVVELFQQALRCFGEGRLDDAEALLTVLLEHVPFLTGALACMGGIASQRGHHSASLAWYCRALEVSPQEIKLHLMAANALLQLGQPDEARSHLLAAVELDPSRSDIWQNLGDITEDVNDAAYAYREAIKVNPADSGAYVSLVRLWLREALFDEAKEVIDSGLQQVSDGKDMEALYPRILLMQGLLEESKTCAEALLLRYPGDFDITAILIDAVLAAKDLAFAGTLIASLLPQSAEQIKTCHEIRCQLALTRYDFASALSILEAGLCGDPSAVEVLLNLVSVNAMRLDIAAANTASRLILERAPIRWQHNFTSSLSYAILREFDTNPHALKAIEGMRGLMPPMRTKALAREMIKEPGFLGYGIALMLTLRQSGILDKEAPLSSAASIPRCVVQFWDCGEIPEEIHTVMASWPRVCGGFEHRVFDDARAESFIAASYKPRVLTAFRMSAQAAMRADIFRLAYLYVHGGVYVDADDLCRNDIAPILSNGYELILMQENIGSIANNFIAVVPGHPWIAAALDYIVKQVIERQGDNIWFLTGPGAVTHVFSHYYLDDLKRMRLPEGVRVWDVYQMKRFISPYLPLRYKRDDRHWVSPKNANRTLFRAARSAGR